MGISHPSQKRYPPELRERAVRMAQDLVAEQGGQSVRVAPKLGTGTESLRNWLRQADVDDGRWPGTSTADRSASPSSSGRTPSCAGSTTSSRQPPRFSSRPSSTVHGSPMWPSAWHAPGVPVSSVAAGDGFPG